MASPLLSHFLHCLTISLLPLRSISRSFMHIFLASSFDHLVECSICLCQIRGHERSKELRCKHIFHSYCLERWLKHQGRRSATCPLCRDCLGSSKKKTTAESSLGLSNGGEEQTTIFFSPFKLDGKDRSTWWLR